MAKTLEQGVLFVCFGNICRSPMAEAVLKKMLEERSLSKGWNVDSAGLGSWYIGMDTDSRAIKVLRSRNFDIKRKARQIIETDFHRFQYILAMDDENLFDLSRIAPPGTKAKCELLGSYDPTGEHFIEDPYFTKGDKAFYIVLEQCKRSCEGFLKKMIPKE